MVRAREAAHWYMKLQTGELSAEDLQRWNEWSRVHANQQAFDGITRLSQISTQLRGIALPDTPSRRRVSRWAGRAPWQVAAVLMVAIAIVVVFSNFGWRSPPSMPVQAYETRAAQHRTVTLDDGSTLLLGGETSVSVSLAADRRTIILERGEALFQVARDPQRPFIVLAGTGTITALGTAFNVNREGDRVVVRVAEGKVQVTQAFRNQQERSELGAVSATLREGEQVMYRAGGDVSPVARIEPEAAAAWREGRLQYRDEQLKYVAADVNRYSGKRILFGDRQAEGLLYTGTVYQDRIDEWLHGLEDIYHVSVVQSDAGHVLVSSRAR